MHLRLLEEPFKKPNEGDNGDVNHSGEDDMGPGDDTKKKRQTGKETQGQS